MVDYISVPSLLGLTVHGRHHYGPAFSDGFVRNFLSGTVIGACAIVLWDVQHWTRWEVITR